MQLEATLSAPSANHLIDTSGQAKLVSFARLYGRIQSSRFPSSRQNPSGSATDAAYRDAYPPASIRAWETISAEGSCSLSDMGVPLLAVSSPGTGRGFPKLTSARWRMQNDAGRAWRYRGGGASASR